MTLIATLLHEIPHEIGDFVILLKSGLNYREAAMAQAITAFGGIFGAIFALEYSSAEQAGNACSWILPFTSGCFIYISLVGIIPDILAEKDWRVCSKQMSSLFLGIFSIYFFSVIFE
jgi:zinc transporter ZupT